jgi:hypothetical protein
VLVCESICIRDIPKDKYDRKNAGEMTPNVECFVVDTEDAEKIVKP